MLVRGACVAPAQFPQQVRRLGQDVGVIRRGAQHAGCGVADVWSVYVYDSPNPACTGAGPAGCSSAQRAIARL